MTLLFQKSQVARMITLACLVGSSAPAQEEQPTFRRYNLRCLAPLLENLDAEAPKTLEEALLAGPAGAIEPRLEEEGVGANVVNFPISSKVEGVQAHFNRGVALLHCLWYREAERAFRTVVHLDPDGAMGYWGLAMANERRPGRARVFAKAAVDRTNANRPALERRWVGILGDYFGLSGESSDSLAQDLRSLRRIRALEDLVIDFPEDVEAKAFMLRQLVLDQYRAGVPITSRLGVEQLAKQLEVLAPGHPSQQYGAFLWLGERPDRGVDFAKRSVIDAPDVAEVWRYAAEVLAGAARSEEALHFYEAAIRRDQAYLSEHLLMPWEAENFSGNYEAFVEALIGMGRIEEAVEWASALMVFPKESVSFPARATSDLDVLGRRLWIKALARSGQWDALEQAIETGGLAKGGDGIQARLQGAFWSGVCALFADSKGDAESAGVALKKLHREALQQGVSNLEEKQIVEATIALRRLQELVSEESPTPIGSALSDEWVTDWLRLAIYDRVGLKKAALEIAEAEKEEHPDHVLAIADFVALSFESGQKREALFSLDRRFRTLAAEADKDLPPLQRLDPIAEEMRLPMPWVLSKKSEQPSGDLDALGPRSWNAPLAPDLALKDATGREHKISGFRGKPVVFNFFLGVQCGYCIEQLNVFKPFLADFRDAGIEFVAISSDPVEVLKDRLKLSDGETYRDTDEFPFLVLADPRLEAFRRFGGFDEFEGGPLHLTVLLDVEGRMIWADRGHAPFKRPAALLSEAKRLTTGDGESR